jgi:hypothetical protein
MANKRSLVAAVLNVTAASDIFTQDIEDIQSPPPEIHKDVAFETKPMPRSPEIQAKIDAGNNPPIDAASPRGGQTFQEARTANDIVKSGGQSVIEPTVEEVMKDVGIVTSFHRGSSQEMGQGGSGRQGETLPNDSLGSSSAPAPTPADPYIGKINAAHDEKEAREAYDATPEELKQDVYSCYLDKLKDLGKRKAKR